MIVSKHEGAPPYVVFVGWGFSLEAPLASALSEICPRTSRR